MKTVYVYILKCNDSSYYTGVTNDLEKRLQQHNQGVINTSYTFSRRPVHLVFHQQFNDPATAISFEKKIKGWSRKKKEALISNNIEDLPTLSSCKNKTTHLNYHPSTSLRMTTKNNYNIVSV